MKLFHFEYEGTKQLGVLADDGVTLIPFSAIDPEMESTCMVKFIEQADDGVMAKVKKAAETMTEGIPCDQVKVLAPIERPPHDIMCLGFNYKDHLEEGLASFPTLNTEEESGYFVKRADKIIGPGEAIVGAFDFDQNLDYEAELAVIIGKRGKGIKREKAEDYVFGYSVFNDVTGRLTVLRYEQWFMGKSMDTYAAMGPCIVTKDEIPFPVKVDVLCSVNGEERQHGNTEMFMNDIPGIIEDLTQAMTIVPGDIIATGTPSGIGGAMDPPQFLKPGDVVTCEVPEIGKLENPVK